MFYLLNKKKCLCITIKVLIKNLHKSVIAVKLFTLHLSRVTEKKLNPATEGHV